VSSCHSGWPGSRVISESQMLLCIILQEVELTITATVRTSNPTSLTACYRTPSPAAAGRGKDKEIIKPEEGQS
jgi:hypothetical protein